MLPCIFAVNDGPYQHGTPMGNPYKNALYIPILPGYLWVKKSPKIPKENTIDTMLNLETGELTWMNVENVLK